jgi:hypothetical protein
VRTIAPHSSRSPARPFATLAAVLGLGWIAAGAPLSGCASEPVGKSTTTTKKTIETPTEKTTVTETRKKETTIDPH